MTAAERLSFGRISLKRDLLVNGGAVIPNEAGQIPFRRTRRDTPPISVLDCEVRFRRTKCLVTEVAPRARNGRLSVIVPHLSPPKETVGRHGDARAMPRRDRPPPMGTHRSTLLPGGRETHRMRILIAKLHIRRGSNSRHRPAVNDKQVQCEQSEAEGHVLPRKRSSIVEMMRFDDDLSNKFGNAYLALPPRSQRGQEKTQRC
jgi:hypothetical protein